MLLPSSNVMNSIFGESLFDDFFEDFARPMRTASRYNTSTGIMRTDVKETDNGYELDIDLPGCKKENVKAELKNGYLTINAETSQNNDQKMRTANTSAARDTTAPAAEASMSEKRSHRRISGRSLRTAS